MWSDLFLHSTVYKMPCPPPRTNAGENGIPRARELTAPPPHTHTHRLVNMAFLATVSCAHVNGVAAIHTEIVKDEVLNDFYKIFPSKFQNKTNGVTPRRWMAWCNPELSALITEQRGSDAWWVG